MQVPAVKPLKKDIRKQTHFRFLGLAAAYGLGVTGIVFGLVLILFPQQKTRTQHFLDAAKIQITYAHRAGIETDKGQEMLRSYNALILQALKSDPYNPTLWAKFIQVAESVGGASGSGSEQARVIVKLLVPSLKSPPQNPQEGR